jgi:hypothetical protein
MRQLSFKSALVFGLFVFSTPYALAADQSAEPASGGYFGNFHASLDIDAINSTPAVFVPYLSVGGKIAYDGSPGEIGYQFDADVNYTDLSWISPTITSSSIGVATVDTAAHLTYIISDNNKVGAFAGLSSITLSTGTASGTNTASLTAGLVGAGLEDIVAVSDDTSMQVRAAILTPGFVSGTYDNGSGPQTASAVLNTGIIGFSVMGGLSHHFNQNISTRADVSYVNFGGGIMTNNLALYNGSITGQYTFDQTPMSLGLTAGYGGGSYAGSSMNDFSLAAKATYSFGGLSSGVTGKLFRSGLFSLLN